MSRNSQDRLLYQKRIPNTWFERAIIWHIHTFQADKGYLLFYSPALAIIYLWATTDTNFGLSTFLAYMTITFGILIFSLNKFFALQELITYIREEPVKSITRIWLESLRFPLFVNSLCCALLALSTLKRP